MPAPSNRGLPDARHRDRGAGFVEYALLIAILAFALLTAVEVFGEDNRDSLNDSASQVSIYG